MTAPHGTPRDIDDDDKWDDNDWQETAEDRIWHPQVIPVDLKTVAVGEAIFLGEYTLFDGDKIWYDILAETGNQMKVFFTTDE